MRELRVAYHLIVDGCISHFLPYYRLLGGLVYASRAQAYAYVRERYPAVRITDSRADVEAYAPEVVLYHTFSWLDGLAPATRHVQVFHGESDKNFYYHSDDVTRYDLCLCAGPMQLEKFRRAGLRGNFRAVGYPKFDLPVEPLALPFVEPRSLVLYAPTWGERSSVARAADRVAALAGAFNVIVKAHPLIGEGLPSGQQAFSVPETAPAGMTVHAANAAAMRRLMAQHGGRLLVVEDDNILHYLAACDLLISDTGAVQYEVLPFDKPVLVLSSEPPTPPEDVLGPDFFANFAVRVAPEALDAAPVRELLTHDPQRAARRALRRRIFQETPGRSASEVAVAAIRELLG